LGKILKILLFERPTNSKQKTPIPVWFVRVDNGFPRGNGKKLRVKMLTSAKIGKQHGDTRTRKPAWYLNLSIIFFVTHNPVYNKY
jgi:hypothetical protein